MTKEAPSKPEKTFDLVMFAEHYQFYVYDANADIGELSVFWDEDSRENMVLLGSTIVGVGTARHLDVPIELEIYKEEPKTESLDDYDQVARCSLEVPTGTIMISGATEDIYEAQTFDVEPGIYGMRIYYGGLSLIDEEGFEGEDFYKIAVWPTDKPPVFEILKLAQEKPKHMY